MLRIKYGAFTVIRRDQRIIVIGIGLTERTEDIVASLDVYHH